MRMLCYLLPAMLVLLISCSRHSTTQLIVNATGVQEATTAPEMLNPPWPDDDHGSVSVATLLELQGKDWYLLKGGWVQGNDFMISADPGKPAWVMYRFHPGASQFDSVHFELADVTDPQKLWIGYADYPAGRWSWTPYTAGMDQLAVGWQQLRSPAGNAYIAFAAFDDVQARLVRSFIQLDLPQWEIHSVDDLHPDSQVFDLGRVGDRAAFIYERNGTLGYELVMCKADIEKPLAGTDWTCHDIDTGYPNRVQATRLLGVGNVPVIAVMYGPDGMIPPEVYYAHGTNNFPNGIGEWYWSSMGYARNDRNLGLAMIDGKPAVAFVQQGFAEDQVIYRRATKGVPLGDADWQEVVAGAELAPGEAYFNVSLASLADRPVLLYSKYPDRELIYAYSPLAMPVDPADFTISAVDNLLGQTAGSCLDLDGKPAVAYLGYPDHLSYAISSVVDPASPGDFQQRHTMDVGVRVEGDPLVRMIRIPGGIGVAYRHAGELSVHYAWTDSTTPAAGTDWKVSRVDPAASSGSLGLVLMPDNQPAILYHTVVPDELRFAQLLP
ncbi:MAG: hypothetical protein H7A35_01960 [Planctomycetales bacterium]|nr:hypothetical protein [bacterium]UNM08824.1 MAG: hypothetical protein H7A35_01960 [Planctomycetales bacterium]